MKQFLISLQAWKCHPSSSNFRPLMPFTFEPCSPSAKSYFSSSSQRYSSSLEKGSANSLNSENDSHLSSQSARAEVSMQRFWKTVDIEKLPDGQYSIRLDMRRLKTPNGNQLLVPKSKLVLATLISREWDEQRKVLKQHSLPLTSLVSRAIDGMNSSDKVSVIEGLIKYLDTDTICFSQSEPATLAKMQAKHWDPLINWIKDTYGVEIETHRDSIFFSKQPESTKTKLKAVVEGFDPLKLAAFERAVHTTKSFVISLALIEGRLTIEEASDASRVEVLSQILRWGEVEDTHDVDYQEIRMKLGSVVCAGINTI